MPSIVGAGYLSSRRRLLPHYLNYSKLGVKVAYCKGPSLPSPSLSTSICSNKSFNCLHFCNATGERNIHQCSMNGILFLIWFLISSFGPISDVSASDNDITLEAMITSLKKKSTHLIKFLRTFDFSPSPIFHYCRCGYCCCLLEKIHQAVSGVQCALGIN